MKDHLTLHERRPAVHKSSRIEEELIIRYILDLDSRRFAPQLAGLQDMVNFRLESKGGEHVGKLFVHWFA